MKEPIAAIIYTLLVMALVAGASIWIGTAISENAMSMTEGE